MKRITFYFLRYLASFNIIYGALGIVSAWFVGSPIGVALSFWMLLSGLILRLAPRQLSRLSNYRPGNPSAN